MACLKQIEPKMAFQWVAFLLRILDVPASNPGGKMLLTHGFVKYLTAIDYGRIIGL